jgi:hypothetical protein
VRAASLLGGESALASYLEVSSSRLALYLNGTARCPTDVSRKVVRVLLSEDLARRDAPLKRHRER